MDNDDDSLFFLKKALKDDITTNVCFDKILNIKTNNIPEEFRITENNNLEIQNYLKQNTKIDKKQIIEKILEKILDDVEHKIHNILLAKKIRKKKRTRF